jgi:hypothetical protein
MINWLVKGEGDPRKGKMIKLEIFEADEALAVSTEWRKAEAKQMAAYRMRWLRPGGNRAGLWAKTTDADGRVRTYGAVPEGQEAKPGRYGVFEIQADGSLAAEPVKTYKTRTPAVNYQLDHRLGGNPDLAVRWVEDTPEVAEPEPVKDRTVGVIPDATTPVGTRIRNIVTERAGHLTTPPIEHGTLGWDDLGIETFGGTEYFRIYDPTYYHDPEPVQNIHDKINELHRQAERLAPRFADLTAERDASTETDPAEITIVPNGLEGQAGVHGGEVVALLKRSANVLKAYFPGGTILGRLYRSDGKRLGDEITYTYRAWTTSDWLECKPGDTETARRVPLAEAVAALLKHAADAQRQA